eukprot:gene41461-50590_t
MTTNNVEIKEEGLKELKNAINTLKQEQGCSAEEVSAVLSCTREEDGASPLHVASSYGHSDVIRTLVMSGADLSIRGRKGDYQDKTPYSCSGSVQAKEVFEVLMFEQIAVGHAAMVQRLLRGGLSPDIKDGSASQDSALHWAVAFGHADIAALLLRSGARVDYANARGESALSLAVKHSHLDIVAMLLDEGAVSGDQDLAALLPAAPPGAASSPAQAIRDLLRHPPAPTLLLSRQGREEVAAAAPALASEDVSAAAPSPRSHHSSDNNSNSNNNSSSSNSNSNSNSNNSSSGGSADTSASSATASTAAAESPRLFFWPPVRHQQALLLGEAGGAGSAPGRELCAGAQEPGRIDRLVVDAGFVMQMRAGRAAGRSHQRDRLFARYRFARPHQDLRQMRIACLETAAMVDLDHLAVTPGAAREGDRSRRRGKDRRAG